MGINALPASAAMVTAISSPTEFKLPFVPQTSMAFKSTFTTFHGIRIVDQFHPAHTERFQLN